jgi:hypothetical protein
MDRVRHYKKQYTDEYQGPQEHDPVLRMISKILLQAVQEVCDKGGSHRKKIESAIWLFFDTEEHATNMRNYALEVTNITQTYLTMKIQQVIGIEKWNELMHDVTQELLNKGE